MSYSNEDVLEKVKDQMDIVQLVGEYVHLKKSGSNHVGLCPFHNEKTPSFTVSESKQIYHCFGCGEGGDGISFIMKRENLDFVDALKFLADKYGIPWEENLNREDSEEKNTLYNMNKEAARYFHNNLMSNKKPREYLAKRGITAEIARKFGIGFATEKWDGLIKHLLEKGFTEDEMLKAGLAGIRKDGSGYFDKFRNRVIFPIIDTRGRVIGFGGRVLDHNLPKYLNSPDTKVFNKGYHLYGLNLLAGNSDRKKILLVEGYMDVISLCSGGVNFAVASLGTALTSNQGKLLKRYGEEVFICYDRDRAGIKATLRAIDVLRELEVDPRVVVLPEGMDPDDFIRENGQAGFQKKINTALSYVDFKVYILKEQYNIEEPKGKIDFTKEVARIIRDMKSPVEQDVYIDKISSQTGVSREAIENEVRGRQKSQRRFKESISFEPAVTKLPPAHLKAEMDLIGFILLDREYFERISKRIDFNDFQDMDCRFCYRIISETYKKSDEIDKEALREELSQDQMSSKKFNDILDHQPMFQATNWERVIEDLIRTIRHNKLISERNYVLSEMEKLEKSGEDQVRFLELLSNIDELNRKINSLVSREEIN
ncbi:DNA primase [Gudongella sp. SC589]|jgi:DNA primase|uniref:DNA primase n=1 Tax=Gudongella sp. SC589 TaxID=3385990 RepID=UPI003904E08B